MGNRNMRKMYTEEEIIDLVKQYQQEQIKKNEGFHLMLLGNCIDVSEDNEFYILPRLYDTKTSGKYHFDAVTNNGEIVHLYYDVINKGIYEENGTEIELNTANISLHDIITGEIISLLDI